MPSGTALVVGRRTPIVWELSNALRLSGFEVRQVDSDDIALSGPAAGPDMLLVSAALGLPRVALLRKRFAMRGRSPTTVVYPEEDFAALEACVRGGFDYVMPPFAPSLLRRRLTSCWERSQLTTAVEAIASAASLHSYERDLSIAREIQAGFLPEILPVPAGWELAARFRPAKLVAGDFYDVFELAGGRRLAAVVADVCDKGIGAALFMALIRTMLRHTAEQAGGRDQFVLQAISSTNRYMARHHRRQAYFCTVFFAVLEPFSGAVLYVNGGHNPAVLVRADGHHTLLAPTGPAVGIFAQSTYLVRHASLHPGDTLFMYTDGVPESRNPLGEFFGMERALELVTLHRESAASVIEEVDAAVLRHAGYAEQHDDITMLALRRSAA